MAVTGSTSDRSETSNGATLGSDIYFTQDVLNFGGSNSDGFTSVAAADDGFVAAGQSAQTSFGNGNLNSVTGKGGYDAIIVKYDPNGDVVWSKNFGGSGSDQFTSVTAVDDCFIAVGYSEGTSFGNGDWAGFEGRGGNDAIAVLYGVDGNVVWKKNFGGSGQEIYFGVCMMADGFVAVGVSQENSFGNGDLTGFTGKGNYDTIAVIYSLSDQPPTYIVTYDLNGGGGRRKDDTASGSIHGRTAVGSGSADNHRGVSGQLERPAPIR